MTSTVSPPQPAPNKLTSFYWDALTRHELEILRCQDCGFYVHYPRPICNKCLSTNLAPEKVSGRGKLYTYTWAAQAFHPYYVDKIPYCIAVVELDEQAGLRVTSNLIDCAREDVKMGMDLEVTFVDAPDQQTLAMFRPAGTNTQEAGK